MIIISNWIGNLLILAVSVVFFSVSIFLITLCYYAWRDFKSNWEFVGFKKFKLKLKKLF